MRDKIKSKFKQLFGNKKRVAVIIAALLIIAGIATYVLAAGPSFKSPYSDATQYGAELPARFTFPDSTSDANREFVPQIGWVVPGQYTDNGKNSAFVSSCSQKLQNYLNAAGAKTNQNQYMLYDSGNNGFFIGFKQTGSGAFTLYPSTCNPNTKEGRQQAYNQYTQYESDINAMKSSVQSWYSSNQWQINLRYPDLYQNNGAGAPRTSGFALDAYFLPPDLQVQTVWTTTPGHACALFYNSWPVNVSKVSVYLYSVENGAVRPIVSKVVPINSYGTWQIEGDYDKYKATKLVATIGAPWLGGTWANSVDSNTQSMQADSIGLTLVGKKIELGSDLYRSDTKSLLQNRWNNNYKEISVTPEPGNPNQPPAEQGDLAAWSLGPVNPSTNQPLGYVKPGDQFKLRFTYSSGFSDSGPATIRLYKYDPKYYAYTYLEEKTVTVSQGTATTNFNSTYTIPEGSTQYVASINYNRGSSGWQEELFNGKRETDYSNNTTSTEVICTLGGSPQGVGYWPPEVEEEVPIVEKVPVWGWRKIKYTPAQPKKIKVRLINDVFELGSQYLG